jgi:hypothetical protein
MSVKTFTFINEFYPEGSVTCGVTVDCLEYTKREITYYNIQISYSYSDKSDPDIVKTPHPFTGCTEEQQFLRKGDIIVKNSMTSEMVKYLFMEDEELSKKIGSSTPQRYRTYIIQTLSSLWD